MKPMYENIDLALGTSLKIQTFNHTHSCELTNWHIHPEYEIVFVKNGAGNLRIDSKTIPYHDGVLLMIGPNIPHSDFGNKDETDNLEVVVQFGKEFLEEKLSVFPEFSKVKKLMLASKKGIIFDQNIKEAVSNDFEIIDQGNPARQLLDFMGILERLSATTAYRTVLGQVAINANSLVDVHRLEMVFQYVNNRYAELITTQLVASRLGLTTNSFCRFFKKMTGQPFISFLNDFRTRKAAELLDQRKLSISEVMYSCGYNDPSYFTKQFKRHQGSTPSSYMALKEQPF